MRGNSLKLTIPRETFQAVSASNPREEHYFQQPIVVMDNVGFHRTPIVVEEHPILDLQQAFLPAYSPFLTQSRTCSLNGRTVFGDRGLKIKFNYVRQLTMSTILLPLRIAKDSWQRQARTATAAHMKASMSSTTRLRGNKKI